MNNFRNLEECNGLHVGRTAFVIASGTSLHGLDLSPLSKHISITVNSGYLAFPNSDYFVSDDAAITKWTYFRDLVRSKTTALLYEDKFHHVVKFFGDRLVFFRHRTGYNITDKYSHTNRPDRIAQSRSSVGTAIHIAHIMRCSPIALLGVDGYRLNGMRYFWQLDPIRYNHPSKLNLHKILDVFSKVSENGIETDTDLLDIKQYWQEHGAKFLERNKVFNLSQKSTIDVFPKTTLSEFLEQMHVQ